MKNYCCALIMCVLPLIAFSQSKPLPGYYIDSSGARHDGFYKKSDFLDAESLKFSDTENGSYTNLQSNSLTEYGIGSDYRFIKKQVSYEKASSTIGYAREANLEKAILFLNVLVDGKADLYSYNDNGTNRFFYSTDDREIRYLVYKKYHESDVSSVKENVQFHNQLWNDLKCDGITTPDITVLRYDDKDLTGFFKRYNSCVSSDAKVYANKSGNKINTRYTLSAGVFESKLSGRFPSGESESKGIKTFGFGGEISVVMPSGKNELFGEINFEQFSGTATGRITATNAYPFPGYHSFTLNTSAIDVGVGFRYNWLLGGTNKVFVDGSVGINKVFSDVESKIEYPDVEGAMPSVNTVKTNSDFFVGLGLGYSFQKHYGIALRYETAKSILTSQYYSAKLSRVGVNFRYTFN